MIDIIEKERQADIFVLKNDIPRACDIYKSIADEVGKDSYARPCRLNSLTSFLVGSSRLRAKWYIAICADQVEVV